MRTSLIGVLGLMLFGSAAILLGGCAAAAPLEPGPPSALLQDLAKSGDGSYVLRGSVAGIGGEPIGGARVVARPFGLMDPDYISSDITDELGYFVVSGLPRSVTLGVTAPGYHTAGLTVDDVRAQSIVSVTMTRIAVPPQ